MRSTICIRNFFLFLICNSPRRWIGGEARHARTRSQRARSWISRDIFDRLKLFSNQAVWVSWGRLSRSLTYSSLVLNLARNLTNISKSDLVDFLMESMLSPFFRPYSGQMQTRWASLHSSVPHLLIFLQPPACIVTGPFGTFFSRQLIIKLRNRSVWTKRQFFSGECVLNFSLQWK